ncbi:MAG TPA: bifunctional diaminohydroxyphosphoribosylaminopyrimidine deaminase/5-amino-6-(5-phosphoribosylamino)uracil reductase RibD [Solirubrobacteraceae bacterium]
MTQALDTDRIHLARAIELAEQGRGRVSPNPLVGAVIARDGTVLGEGWHSAYGHAHAEVEALAAVGDRNLAGATMYVSLEPCCHHGQTPPCTEAILAAGLTRVVVASDDPSEKASGRGLGILRDEGVEVAICDGELSARARAMNQPFRKHARTGVPWVLFKSAMSLDGKVATSTGDSKWISSAESRRLVHQWRTECDAAAVGIGTALADDPRLTARDVEPGPDDHVPQPRRVIFDSTARLPLDSRLVRAAEEIPLTVVTTRAAHRADVVALQGAGAEVIVAVGENDPAQVRSALRRLGDQGITSILLEGGPRLAGAFLDAGEVDEMRLFLAPLVVGGRTARDPLEGTGAESIADAVRATSLDCEPVGEDVLVTARMREW